ncbi:MAG: TetR/AcrR family transcriptional regulator, partial [Finegoldia magna]|nr:TetR/AcrR family transcriptional regulator [Finegoldia magna]
MNADYTKKMIMENLINLLNRLPLNKITVGKLAEECGINRNTIYYHFKDLNQIIDTIFEIRLQKVLDESEDMSWEDNFIEEMQFAIDNKTAIYHIYNSISRKTLSDYLYNKSGQIMRNYIENVDK